MDKTVLLAAVPSTLAALGALITSLRNAGRIQQVHLTMNSRLDELIEATKTASHAEGFAAGQESQRKGE
jgi:hypothetical protein